MLALAVAAPGDFSTYTLTIVSTSARPVLRLGAVQLQGQLPQRRSTAQPPPPAARRRTASGADRLPGQGLRQLQAGAVGLLGAALPAWVERSEADLGVMLMEALARSATSSATTRTGSPAEATLATATQRLSLVRHARLVDYEPAPATAATTVLQLDVAPGVAAAITSARRWLPARSARTARDRLRGRQGLADRRRAPVAGAATPVDPRWNRGRLVPVLLGRQPAVPAGGLDRLLASIGHGLGFGAGPAAAARHRRRPTAPTRRSASSSRSSRRRRRDRRPAVRRRPHRIDLEAPTTLDHDLATHRRRQPRAGGAGPARDRDLRDPRTPAGAPPAAAAVVSAPAATGRRTTRGPTTATASAPGRWPGSPPPRQDRATPRSARCPRSCSARPRRRHGRSRGAGSAGCSAPGPSRPGRSRSRPSSTRRSGTQQRRRRWFDYDGDGGTTIRFGDGVFGLTPPPGHHVHVPYRVGGGAAGNVPADTIVTVEPGQTQAADVIARAPTRSRPPAAPTRRPRSRSATARRRRSAPSRCASCAPRTTRRRPQSLPVGAAGRHHVPLDRQLADRVHHRRPARQRGADDRRARVSSPTCSTGGGWPATRATSCRRATCRSTCRSRSARSPTRSPATCEAAVLARAAARAAARRRAPGSSTTRGGRFGRPLESSALLAAIQACPGVAGRVPGRSYRQRGASAGLGAAAGDARRSPPTRSCASTTTRAGPRPDRCR